MIVDAKGCEFDKFKAERLKDEFCFFIFRLCKACSGESLIPSEEGKIRWALWSLYRRTLLPTIEEAFQSKERVTVHSLRERLYDEIRGAITSTVGELAKNNPGFEKKGVAKHLLDLLPPRPKTNLAILWLDKFFQYLEAFAGSSDLEKVDRVCKRVEKLPPSSLRSSPAKRRERSAGGEEKSFL